MTEIIASGMFSLVGALIGAFVSLLIYSKTMKKSLQLEVDKIRLQMDAELSIRLFDKKEAYLAELLSVLSTVRTSAIDIMELGVRTETEKLFERSKDVASEYLYKYEKANILYLTKRIRREAAEILRDWKHIETKNINKDMCKVYKRNIEKLVNHIRIDINRDESDE